MNFAFSTVACPTWDFPTIAARAKEYGYGGVEIRGFLNESILSASNPFHSDPANIRRIFADAEIDIACLSSSIAFQNSRRKDARLADDLRRYIDTAASLGCSLVKIFDMEVGPGHSRASAGNAMGDWLVPLGDYAAERDIVIVIENALSFRTAKEMWTILDRLSHPSIACCWDLFNAVQVGEPPSVSVPTLNSRIQYTQFKDAKFGPLGTMFCKVGEGEVPIEKFLIHLRGIGYTGWVTLEWEKAWLPGLAEPEEILPPAIRQLKKWTGESVPEPPAGEIDAGPESLAPAVAS